jgi:predicted dinucleotide-binding enzyme
VFQFLKISLLFSSFYSWEKKRSDNASPRLPKDRLPGRVREVPARTAQAAAAAAAVVVMATPVDKSPNQKKTRRRWMS